MLVLFLPFNEHNKKHEFGPDETTMAYNQPPTTSSSHAPSNITSIYRQRLSLFLLSSDASFVGQQQHASRTRCASAVASWMGDAARSVALRSVRPLADEYDDDEAAGRVAADASEIRRRKAPSSSARGMAAAEKKNGRACPDHPGWSDFVCMTCGTLLFPPPPPACTAADAVVVVVDDDAEDDGLPPSMPLLPLLPTGDVRLRPLKRGRTRRRRASRSKARELHDRALFLQRRGGGGGGNSSNIDASRRDALSKERMRLVAYSHRLGDGRARNCIVAKCAHCGTRRKRKGVEVRKDEKMKKEGVKRASVGAVDDDDAARRRKGGGRTRRQPPERMMAGKSKEASRTCDDSDFISLNSIGGDGASTFPSKQHQHRPDERQGAGKRKLDEKDSFVSPLLVGKKKKKKTKKPELEKRGDLMNFLSSLND
jgi:hypothetical protein